MDTCCIRPCCLGIQRCMGRIGQLGTPRRCHCSEPLGPLCTAANWPLAQRGVEGTALSSLGDAARSNSLYMYSACHTRGCIVMGLGLRCALVVCGIVWRWAPVEANNADCTQGSSYNYDTNKPCDGCAPKAHPVNFTSNLNTTTDGYWCTDYREGSPQDDGDWWSFFQPPQGNWQCMNGLTSCGCTATCIWSGVCNVDSDDWSGACRCAMNGDNTQHYCFKTAMPCAVCPAGSYRANCGCMSNPLEPYKLWVKGCTGGQCLPTPPGKTATQPSPNLVVFSSFPLCLVRSVMILGQGLLVR